MSSEARHRSSVNLRPLSADYAAGCDEVIGTLPYHFGDEEGRRECAEAVRTSSGLVAVESGQVIGFLTVQYHFEASAEITWMAVRAERRGRGVGRALIDELRGDLRDKGMRLLLVTTLSASFDEGNVEDGYDRTRAFYQRMGFIPARELPNLWDNVPAMLFVLPLEQRESDTMRMISGVS